VDHQLAPYTKEDISIPLSLGAICSYWREIAWSTPSLWSSLVVRVPSKNDSRTATGIAQEWLARSGQLPLSIRILVNTFGIIPSALVDIINQYSTRWSDLDLYLPTHYYQHFHATDDHAPILKSIRFHGSNHNAIYTNLILRLTCPRLERANLSSLSIRETNIQWDNLTHLTLHSMSTTDSFHILRKTPRLVFCEVSGSCRILELPSGPVFTPLRSLHMITKLAKFFLDYLIAPHLEEFSLLRHNNLEVISSFLRRSACSLRSFFTILSIPSSFESLMELLQSVPSLNTLSIISRTTTSDFENNTPEDYDPPNILQLVAKVLSSQSTSLHQGFLPNLKILEYTGKLNLRPGNYGDLCSMPPADNAVHGPLQLFKLDLYPATRIPKNMISYLLSVVERGVTVNVLSKSKDLQLSIDYYRCREDRFCGDWADNLDSSLFS
jgi:hypothetical protein